MKSFFQLSEQARRHQKKSNLHEVGEAEVAQAQTNQQQQNAQGQGQTNQPKATTAPEGNDIDFVQGLAKSWDGFFKNPQNAAAIEKLKSIQPAQQLSQTINNLAAEFGKVVQAVQTQQKSGGAGTKPQANMNTAGSNQAGSAAGAAPVKTAAPPIQTAQA